MNLRRYKNLVPDSALHRELEKLLQEQNGRVPLQQVCEQVMQIRGQDGQTAEKLVATLIEGDPRMLGGVTAAAFGQRRKMLRQRLRSLGLDVARLLADAGLDGTVRAQDIDVAGFIRLTNSAVSLAAEIR